jgi:hypothetical protein
MPYTRPWTEVFALPGSRDADEIDDNDREHHVDMTERLDDIIRGGAVADPWVVLGVGLVTRYSWALGYVSVVSGTLGVGNFISPVGASALAVVHMPVIVPIGNRLTGVKFRLNIGSGASATGVVYKTDITGNPTAVGAPAVASGSGWNDTSIGAVSSIAAAGDSYYASVSLNNNGGLAEFLDMEVTLAAE